MIVEKSKIKEVSDLDKATALAMLQEFRKFSDSKKSLVNLVRGLDEKHIADIAKMVREKMYDLLEKQHNKDVIRKIYYKD